MLHTQSVGPCFALTPPFPGHACCFVVKFQRLELTILIKGDANTVLKHQSLYPDRPFVRLLVCPYVDLVQMTVRQQHQRRVSAVHLAGSYILTCTDMELSGTRRRQHSSNVLMHVLMTPAVSLSIIGLAPDSVICMT